MNREEVFKQLNEVFQDVFDDETITVNENTTADDIGLHNVGEMADLILSKQA